MQKRFTPAANGRDNKKEMWKLTTKQWLIYYWVLAHSNWNPDEQHYFIYKEKMPSTQIQRGVGVTAPTIRTAIEKFLDMGIFVQHPYIDTAYILSRPLIYTSLDTNILKFCLAFHQFFGSDMVTFYAIIRRLYAIDKVVKFNLSEFAMLMGYLKQNINKQQIHLMLAICHSVGLISFTEKVHTNQLGQQVVTFIVTDVKDVATKQLEIYYKDEEVDAAAVAKMYHTLMAEIDDKANGPSN